MVTWRWQRGRNSAPASTVASGISSPEKLFNLSQSYYYGLALDNPAPDHRCEVIDGRFVDLCDDLFKFQDKGGPKTLVGEASDTIERAPAGSLLEMLKVRVADDHARVALALREIPNEGCDWNDWNSIGMRRMGCD